ncbi:NAD-dependent epimerase/dehydratase family protein [Chloroflexota bacterium]
MAYLITGGTGLIGSNIIRHLVKEGEQVVVYDWFPEKSLLEQLLNEDEKTRVKIVQGDVTDLPHLIHTVKENDVNIIIHMAGLLVEDSKANPPLAVKINCEGTINVFETARLLGLRKVVWASSMSVFFGAQAKYPEEYVPNDAPPLSAHNLFSV